MQPALARYDTTLREFILPYDDVRRADDPERALLAFFQSTYAAAADLGRGIASHSQCRRRFCAGRVNVDPDERQLALATVVSTFRMRGAIAVRIQSHPRKNSSTTRPQVAPIPATHPRLQPSVH